MWKKSKSLHPKLYLLILSEKTAWQPMMHGNYDQREKLPSNHGSARKKINLWSMIGYIEIRMSQWQRIVRYERHITPNNDDDAGNFARQTHFALPRDENDISAMQCGRRRGLCGSIYGWKLGPWLCGPHLWAWIYKHVFYSDRWMSDGWHMSLGVYIANQLNICVQV